MKRQIHLVFSILTVIVLAPISTSHAIDLPTSRPEVTLSSGYEGIWVGFIPGGCAGIPAKAKRRKRRSVLRLCLAADSDGNQNRRLTGSLRTQRNLKLLQDDASTKPVGKRLTVTDSMSLSTKDDSDNAFMLFTGVKGRTTNMALEVADEKDSAVAEVGDLVGTMGNCGLATVWEYRRANPNCSTK